MARQRLDGRAAVRYPAAMQDEGYPVPAGPHRVELVIERSRFIATVERAADAAAARAFIDAVRADHRDATHNCWAFVAGPPGSTAVVGLSDAGEPHGTAGRPMLDVLLHSGVGEIVAVVTRYYGGVKLGKGGLVRAYGGAVQQALATLPTIRRVEQARLAITVGYADVDVLRRLAGEAGAEILDERYEDVASYRVILPVSGLAAFRQQLLDRTAGRAVLERVHED
jgi:uncharacterized YigZ family protein